jgi:hypothetical protein
MPTQSVQSARHETENRYFSHEKEPHRLNIAIAHLCVPHFIDEAADLFDELDIEVHYDRRLCQLT